MSYWIATRPSETWRIPADTEAEARAVLRACGYDPDRYWLRPESEADDGPRPAEMPALR